MNYLVMWNINLEANSPEDAARQALKIHRDPSSTATYFEVMEDEGSRRGDIKHEGSLLIEVEEG